MGVPPLNLAPMTVEEFFAFTDTRPDEEKWELIEGEPVLHATPSGFHQRIVANLIYLLGALERQELRSWIAIPGIGVSEYRTAICLSPTFWYAARSG